MSGLTKPTSPGDNTFQCNANNVASCKSGLVCIWRMDLTCLNVCMLAVGTKGWTGLRRHSHLWCLALIVRFYIAGAKH